MLRQKSGPRVRAVDCVDLQRRTYRALDEEENNIRPK